MQEGETGHGACRRHRTRLVPLLPPLTPAAPGSWAPRKHDGPTGRQPSPPAHLGHCPPQTAHTGPGQGLPTRGCTQARVHGTQQKPRTGDRRPPLRNGATALTWRAACAPMRSRAAFSSSGSPAHAGAHGPRVAAPTVLGGSRNEHRHRCGSSPESRCETQAQAGPPHSDKPVWTRHRLWGQYLGRCPTPPTCLQHLQRPPPRRSSHPFPSGPPEQPSLASPTHSPL